MHWGHQVTSPPLAHRGANFVLGAAVGAPEPFAATLAAKQRGEELVLARFGGRGVSGGDKRVNEMAGALALSAQSDVKLAQLHDRRKGEVRGTLFRATLALVGVARACDARFVQKPAVLLCRVLGLFVRARFALALVFAKTRALRGLLRLCHVGRSSGIIQCTPTLHIRSTCTSH